jgi:hypothetical protein
VRARETRERVVGGCLREQRVRERQVRWKGDDREATAIEALRLAGLRVCAGRSEEQEQREASGER